MTNKSDKKTVLRAWPVYAVCALLAGLVIWSWRKNPSPNRGKSLAEAISQSIQGHKAGGGTMQEIIDARRTWEPVLLDWYGRRTPEWTFVDIEGGNHHLRGWRGQEVVLLFWATWSPASFMQAAHLERLRQEVGPGAVIAAFSDEAADKLSQFAQDHEFGCILVSLKEAPPEPFRAPLVREVPTAFFIDAEGRIKLVVEGIMPFFQAKAILEAVE